MTAHITKRLPLVDLRRDGGTQVRETMNAATVQDYADALAEGVEFPAVTVFFDGEAHWLADGFHRVLAHERAGLVDVLAEVHAGSKRDALLFAVGANANHGLPRTNKDKRRAVEILLRDEEWTKLYDADLARKADVTSAFVGKVRRELEASGDIKQFNTRQGADGSTRDTSRSGRKAKPADPAPAPLSNLDSQPPLVNLTSHPAVDAIASAPTRDALDAAYTAANGASLPKDAAEEAGKVYQRRLSEMRESAALVAGFESAIGSMVYAEHELVMDSIIAAQRDGKINHDQRKALDAAWWKKLNSLKGEAVAKDPEWSSPPAPPAHLDPATVNPVLVDLAARHPLAGPSAWSGSKFPATTHEQVDLFTQASTPKPETAAVDAAEVIALRAKVEALEAEVGAFRAWVATVEQRSIALAPTIKGAANLERIRRLIELAGSPSENEARNAAVTACRMIRDQGVKLLTSDPGLLDDIHATNRLILETARKMGVQL